MPSEADRLDAPVAATDHAEDRFVQRRACYTAVGAVAIWHLSEERPDIADVEPDSDRARYHARTDVVLLACWDVLEEQWTIVTALRGENAQNPAIRRAVEEVGDD